MKYAAIGLGLASLAMAAPLEKKQDIDAVVLQFALTLEHLENVFYKQALTNFSAEQFAAAGYGPNYYNSLRYISSDEESHTKFLTTALQSVGQTPVEACTYSFPYTDVVSFITLSTVLEGVGTSAYLGGAGLITNKAYLTAAGAILVSEALHTSLQRTAIKAVPNANPYGTPLEPNSVFSLAAAFIVACPESNTPLPFTPYPALTFTGTPAFGEQPNLAAGLAKRDGWEGYGSKPTKSVCTKKTHPTTASGSYGTAPPAYGSGFVTAPTAAPTAVPTTAPVARAPSAGASVTFTGASAVPAGSFLTFVAGLTVTSVAGEISGDSITAAIPTGISGQTYVFVTSAAASANTLDTSAILFGPSIIEVSPAPPSIDFSYFKN